MFRNTCVACSLGQNILHLLLLLLPRRCNSTTIRPITSGKWDSAVGIVTRLVAGCPTYRGMIPDRGKAFIAISKNPDYLWGQLSLLFNECGGSFHGLKRPEREAVGTPDVMPRLRTSGDVPVLPNTPSLCAQGLYVLSVVLWLSKTNLLLHAVGRVRI
jgi:hypothetical protein